jgi:DeoR/GlpR family transcriptional regulator of sugar metabolism
MNLMRTGKDSRLLAEQRRRKILDLIEQRGQITVRDVVDKFSISAVTARGDLDALAGEGMAVRSHGGAVRRLEASQDYPLRLKETLHHAEKVRIGRAAAELIQNHETVILDSGSTTAELARHLKSRRLQSVTVITHALNVASELIDATDKEVNVIADFSKVGRRSVSRIGVLSQIHRLVTDTRAPAEFVEALRKSKIEVITA